MASWHNRHERLSQPTTTLQNLQAAPSPLPTLLHSRQTESGRANVSLLLLLSIPRSLTYFFLGGNTSMPPSFPRDNTRADMTITNAI